MNLAQWYMQRAQMLAKGAEHARQCGYGLATVKRFQDKCAVYAALAQQAAERYSAVLA